MTALVLRMAAVMPDRNAFAMVLFAAQSGLAPERADRNRRRACWNIVMALLTASGAQASGAQAALQARVAQIAAPYASQTNTAAAWEYPVWSREIAALVAQWRKVAPTDEVDDLSDGDWLCLCQDWDHKAFAARIVSADQSRPSTARVSVRLDLGWGTTRDAVWLFRREDDEWRLDDIVARDFPEGLKQALRATIAKDRRLTRP